MECRQVFVEDVAAEQFGVTTPRRFDQAAVLMLDFAGFTDMPSARIRRRSSPSSRNIANIALRIVHYVRSRNETLTHRWRCRVGINTGPVIGSIVGIQRYVYDIFGPGVNLAARMEAVSRPMTITLTEDTYRLIQSGFRFREIGERDIKGFGKKKLYELEGSDEVDIEGFDEDDGGLPCG